MKISGFTIIKNAVINDYPIVEAISSILPLVDEMIVLCGDSQDSTNDLIAGIKSEKIRIHYSVWDKNLRSGGEVLAVETNKAFQLIDKKSDWAFYIQADEVVHEKYYENIRKACLSYKDDLHVEGLLFEYLHFFGTYDYVGDSRQWYSHEVRIIRNDNAISAYRDAQGFRKGKKKLHVKPADACIYHYGYVKTPGQMKKKINEVSRYWKNDEELKSLLQSGDFFDYTVFDSLVKFKGEHPKVMKKRIEQQNLNVELDISKKKFSLKDRILYEFERIMGIRPFDFRNYKIIR